MAKIILRASEGECFHQLVEQSLAAENQTKVATYVGPP